ncbi:DUF7594 domain-containing protein, partial [Cohnella caldifontis]|uniref:CBM96 family carbohydrate-binding protein n=1 Tax=Cohnella caldifontis TaxID=3027471 RepID=UPI0023EBC976
MKATVVRIMLFAMIYSLFQPLYGGDKTFAATTTIYAMADLYTDQTGTFPNGNAVKVNLVGYQNDSSGNYGASAMLAKFDVSEVPPNVISAKLSLYVRQRQAVVGTPYLNIYGSYDDSWTAPAGNTATPTDIPSKDVTIVTNDSSATTINQRISYDVTDFIQSQVAGDGIATFVLDGVDEGPFGTKVQYGIGDTALSGGAPYLEIDADNNVPNQPPTDISLSSDTIMENSSTGTTIGTFTATDADSSPPFTYTLEPGADSDSFSILGDKLQSSAVFDYEAKNSYTITVKVKDSSNNEFTKSFTISVTDENEAPPNSTISPTTADFD